MPAEQTECCPFQTLLAEVWGTGQEHGALKGWPPATGWDLFGQLSTACPKSLSQHWAGNWSEVPSKILSPQHVWLLPAPLSNEINNELCHLFTRRKLCNT